MEGAAVVSRRAVQRLRGGHPWIFRSDVERRPPGPAGIVPVEGPDGAPLGYALWSPLSEISLRRIETDLSRTPDAAWWHEKLRTAIARRASLALESNAYRLVHGEGDGLPSLVVDKYGDVLVVQLLSAGVDAWTDAIVSSLVELTQCTGILARNDPAARGREGLPREVKLLYGEVPRTVEVVEQGGLQLTGYRVSFLTDVIISQRYVEIEGTLRRALVVVKMRGSDHSRAFWTYESTDTGVVLRESLTAFDGVTTGVPTRRR